MQASHIWMQDNMSKLMRRCKSALHFTQSDRNSNYSVSLIHNTGNASMCTGIPHLAQT